MTEFWEPTERQLEFLSEKGSRLYFGRSYDEETYPISNRREIMNERVKLELIEKGIASAKGDIDRARLTFKRSKQILKDLTVQKAVIQNKLAFEKSEPKKEVSWPGFSKNAGRFETGTWTTKDGRVIDFNDLTIPHRREICSHLASLIEEYQNVTEEMLMYYKNLKVR